MQPTTCAFVTSIFCMTLKELELRDLVQKKKKNADPLAAAIVLGTSSFSPTLCLLPASMPVWQGNL